MQESDGQGSSVDVARAEVLGQQRQGASSLSRSLSASWLAAAIEASAGCGIDKPAQDCKTASIYLSTLQVLH